LTDSTYLATNYKTLIIFFLALCLISCLDENAHFPPDDNENNSSENAEEQEEENANTCLGSPLAPVVYMDDTGVRNSDPNGVQDLAIVLGWSNKINLVALGVTRNDDASFFLVRDIVNQSGVQVDIFNKQFLVNKIISTARDVKDCTNTKLTVSIGGEWHKLATALRQAPDIADHIRAIGIGGPNVANVYDSEGNKRAAYNYIVSAIGGSNVVRIDDKPAVPNLRMAYEARGSYTVNYLDQFYNDNIRPALSGIRDNANISITDSNQYYITHTRLLNLGQGEGDGRNGSKLRIADFLTVAEVIWGGQANFNIFNKDDVYPEIALGLRRIHP